MDQEAFASYIRERYESQLSAISAAVVRKRRVCRGLRMVELASIVSLLFFVFLDWRLPAARVVFTLSLVALVSAVFLHFLNLEQRQIQLSQTADLLLEERTALDAGMNGYSHNSDPHHLFIHRVEAHLSRLSTARDDRFANYSGPPAIAPEAVSNTPG